MGLVWSKAELVCVLHVCHQFHVINSIYLFFSRFYLYIGGLIDSQMVVGTVRSLFMSLDCSLSISVVKIHVPKVC